MDILFIEENSLERSEKDWKKSGWRIKQGDSWRAADVERRKSVAVDDVTSGKV